MEVPVLDFISREIELSRKAAASMDAEHQASTTVGSSESVIPAQVTDSEAQSAIAHAIHGTGLERIDLKIPAQREVANITRLALGLEPLRNLDAHVDVAANVSEGNTNG